MFRYGRKTNIKCLYTAAVQKCTHSWSTKMYLQCCIHTCSTEMYVMTAGSTEGASSEDEDEDEDYDPEHDDDWKKVCQLFANYFISIQVHL